MDRFWSKVVWMLISWRHNFFINYIMPLLCYWKVLWFFTFRPSDLITTLTYVLMSLFIIQYHYYLFSPLCFFSPSMFLFAFYLPIALKTSSRILWQFMMISIQKIFPKRREELLKSSLLHDEKKQRKQER